MKQTFSVSKTILTAGALLLTALAFGLIVIAPHAADKPVAEKPATATTPALVATPEPSKLAREMLGTWILVGKPGKVSEPLEAGGRLKFRTGAHWTMTHSDANSGLVVIHDGGTYTLEGDTYTETIEYATKPTSNDIGRTFVFKVKVEGDFMTQEGVGNPYTEVWKRLK